MGVMSAHWKMLYIDFETKSACDLKTAGVYNYAQDASTEVLCMSYAFDDEDVVTWLPTEPFPERVRNYTGQIRAHNAAFERLIFWYVLGINFKLEQFYCTAAQARANCAPGSLEDVGRFASASMKKDHRGAQLIRLMCIPPFQTSPELMAEMVKYCAQDVRAMRAISQGLRPLSDEELADYHVNERINDRGVLIDVPLAQAAIKYAAAELEEIQSIVTEVTQGTITSVRSPKMRQWVQDQVGPEALKLMWTGEKYSIDKTVRANLLQCDDVPAEVKEVIQCADDLWASSVAKFNRMAQLADVEDHRVRGAFVFAGGSATGRASSYGLQVHNFTRKCAEDPEAVRQAMVRGHSIVPTYGKRVTDVLKGMLRPALIPAPGNVFVVSDWSSIEGRVNPWLSNCPAGEAKLDVFRSGLDPYKVNAMASFGVTYDDVTSDQRQVGKVQELACFAKETKVLTNNGVKAIVAVDINDLLWDGETWVQHQGVIHKGNRWTIDLAGVKVTPEHLIKTGPTWTQARRLVSNRQLLTQALETGSANLPFWAPKKSSKAPRGFGMQKFNALVGLNPIWYTCTIFLKARLLGAISVLRNKPGTGAKIGTHTLACAPMMPCAVDCLTAYPPPSPAARRQITNSGPDTVRGVSMFIQNGLPTKLNFSHIWSALRGMTTRLMTWTELTLIRATRRETLGSFLEVKTEAATSVPFTRCNSESTNLRPVFDILSCGPRNRFTVLTDVGPLLVHNCGFLGGAGSFLTFGRVYGLHLTAGEIERAILVWRRANPWAIKHGQDLEEAYTRAMRNKGHEFRAGRVCYLFDGLHLWYALPSGRVLCYPYAKLEDDGVTYAKAAWKPAADAKEWPRARLWRGLAVENVTQAVANDILRHSLRQINNVVLHIHDEIVVEVPEAVDLEKVMCEPPPWATGLPLAVEAKVMRRYGK